MRKVTDPELINQLNQASFGSSSITGLKKVTDPELLSKLNSNQKKDVNLIDKLMSGNASRFAEKFREENRDLYPPDIEGGLSTRPQRTAAIETAAMAIPYGRAAKLLPESSSFLAKALANYGGAVGQNAAIGAATNALEGESPFSGAMTAGGATAALHPLLAAATSGNPLTRIGALGALGGAGGYGAQQLLGAESTPATAISALLTGALGLKGKTARDTALLNHLKDINLSEANPRLQASERLGLSYLTPAEATGLPYIGSRQGKIGHTPEASKLMYESAEHRQKSEQKAIDNLLTTIGKKEQKAPQLEELYRSSYESSVSPEFIQNLKSSSIINEAYKRVKSDSAYKDKLKGVPEENFLHLDQVKRALNDMEEVAIRKGQKDKARLIREKTKEMTDSMDDFNPDYKDARKLAQRLIISDKIQEVMNQKKVKGTTFFRKFLENENKYKKLLKDLSNVPEAQNQLKDMKLAFEHLIDKNTARASAKLAATSTSEAKSTSKDLMRFLHKFQGGKYDKAAVELITDPKWADELSRIKDLDSNSKKTQAIANLLGRAAGTTIRQTVNNYSGDNRSGT